jgi:predicted ester cyclase
MSTQENKAFILRYFDAISGKDKPPKVVDEYVADADQELKQEIASLEAAFPHYELIADDLVAEGDKVAVRATGRGTHKGDLMGIPPTGVEVTISLMLIYQIADGKIVKHWMVADDMSLMLQLGVIPTPE